MLFPKISTTHILLAFLIILLLKTEWEHRAKKDGKKNATIALGLALVCIVTGLIATSIFGLAGLAIPTLAIGVATIVIFLSRSHPTRP